TEVNDERFRAVELDDQVLAATLHRGDLVTVEQIDEFLLVLVAPDRPRAGDFHRLDLLSDDLLVEIAAQHLDLRQLRHRHPPALPLLLLADASMRSRLPPA